jgi:hypothetical protein
MRYFAPLDESGLYSFYRPRPWKIIMNDYELNGNINCILEKLRWDKSYDGINGPRNVVEAERLNIVKEVRKF